MYQELETLFLRALAHHGLQVLEHIIEPEGKALEFEAIGLDLREVEDVVDHAEQGCAGAVDLLDVIALAWGEIGFEAQVRHADHRVHRCADLVAHVGEEHALGASGVLRALPRGLHFLGLRVDLGIGLHQVLLLAHEFVFLLLHLLGRDLEFLGLDAEDLGLALRLLQEFAGAAVALEDLEVEREWHQQQCHQFALEVVEGLQGGEFDHSQRAPVDGEYGCCRDGAGCRAAQPRGDPEVAVGNVTDLEDPALLRALPYQPLSGMECSRLACGGAEAVATCVVVASVCGLEGVEGAHLSAHGGRHLRHQCRGELPDALAVLHGGGDIRQPCLDLGGSRLGLRGFLQGEQCARHGTDLVTTV